ncbi:MAG: DUF3127 domain-containing protein [Flavobacteriales bacterium]|jgi:hypothetical protein|nr:DUF3127 domain-containing protein [Flavobacteriales bacterium]
MAQVNITGTIKVLGPTQEISEKFRKREVVITEAGGQYPQHIPVEFTQDQCGLLDPYKAGDQVTVSCYVNGREWTGRDGVTKHFLSLKGSRIDRQGEATAGATGQQPAAQPSAHAAAPPPTAQDMPPAGKEDDLPF